MATATSTSSAASKKTAEYIISENVSELAAELARVAIEEDVRGALRKAGLERATHFDWQRTAAQTMEVYERAARLPRKANTHPTLSEQLNPR